MCLNYLKDKSNTSLIFVLLVLQKKLNQNEIGCLFYFYKRKLFLMKLILLQLKKSIGIFYYAHDS